MSGRLWVAVLSLALLIACGGLTGCRVAVPVEGNLAPRHFASSQASLTKDPGGRLFVVAAEGERIQPFVVVRSQEREELFWTRPLGERAAEILPLTRMDIDWYNRAMRQAPELTFLDDLTDLEIDESIGLWGGGGSSGVRWLGPPPSGEQQAVVIPLSEPLESLSLAENIAGVVHVSDDAVETLGRSFPPHRGPYVVILDGFVEDRSPRVGIPAGMTGLGSQVGPEWTWVETGDGAAVRSNAELQEKAARAGVEILVVPTAEGHRVGFAADAGPPGVGPWAKRPAIAESGILLANEATDDDRRQVLRALGAIYGGHPLSAAYFLAQADHWSVDQNEFATLLRHQDLLSAGGYIAWVRARTLEDAEGLGPEVALYMARAYAYQGHWRAVDANADRAYELFSVWPRGEGRMGMASARILMAQAAAGRGDAQRSRALWNDVAQIYARARDPYREGLARRRMALLDPEAGEFERVARFLGETRAEHEAARSILLGAAARIDVGDREGAADLLSAWEDQSQEFPRLNLLADALRTNQALARGDAPALDRVRENRAEALALSAWDATVVSSVALQQMDPAGSSEELRQVGEVLIEARLRASDPVLVSASNRALAALCTDVLFPMEELTARIDRRCLHRIQAAAGEPEGVRSLMSGGYRFLQRGNLEGARSVADFLLERVSSQQGDWPLVRAEVLLLDSAVLHEEGDSTERSARIQEAFDLMRQNVAPREAPELLLELGDFFQARGFEHHTGILYRAAGQAARSANRSTVAADATLKLAESLARAGQWQDLLELSGVESPLHSVRVDLYRAQGQFLSDNRGAARGLWSDALRQASEFGDFQRISVSLMAGRLAAERGEREAAMGLFDEAMEALDGLPEGLAGREEGRVLRARAEAMRAWQWFASGDGAEAQAAIERALGALEEVATGAAPQVRREVLEVALLQADEEGRRAALRGLEELNRGLGPDTSEIIERDVGTTLVQALITHGEARRAKDRADVLLADGLALGTTRDEHQCRFGEVLLLSGRRDAGMEALQRCAEAPEDQLAAQGAFWLGMANPDASASYRAGLARHLAGVIPPEREATRRRLRWVAESTEPVEDYSAALEEELRGALEADDLTDDQFVDRVVALVDYLIHVAEWETAGEELRPRSTVFYRADRQDEFVRLRLRASLGKLDGLQVLSTMGRTLEEAPATTPEGEAEAAYLRAVALAQTGQVEPALAELRGARELLDEGARLLAAIEALESALLPLGS